MYTEVSGVGKGISLTDAYPVADSIGKVQVGEGKVFDFKVISNISMNSSIGYQVTARKKTGSTLSNSAVKVYLTEVNGTEQELLLSKYSELSQTDKVDSSKFDERILYEGTIPANTSNYEKNFRLRMWVSDDTDFSDGSMNDKTFTLTVNVYADGKVVTDNLDTTNTLDSITVSDCTLDPVFSSATTEYSCTVKNNISTVNVNATATSSKSKVRGLGTKDLTVGKNTLPIRVIAEDGSEKIYNVNVTRKQAVQNVSIFGKKFEVIDAEPTLTTTSEESGDESGLYKSTDTNTGNPTYYFRGNVENNYVFFAGQTWRIVRINEDGTIRIIMKDGINDNSTYSWNTTSDYETFYFSNSNLLKELENWYTLKLINYDSYITDGFFCEQVKVKANSTYRYNNITALVYDKYTANFTCTNDNNNHGILYKKIGLISYDEVVYAGGYINKKMSAWYLYSDIDTFMINPGGFDKTTGRGWVVYRNQDSSISGGTLLEMHRPVRPVINIKPNVNASGTGTSSDPFTIE